MNDELPTKAEIETALRMAGRSPVEASIEAESVHSHVRITESIQA